MGTAITWLIAFFVVITTAFAVINSVITTGSSRAEAAAVSNQMLIDDIENSFSLVSAVQSGGGQNIELVVTNNGRLAVSDFEDWVVTVRYDQNGADDETYLAPFFSDTLVDNSWVVDSFWLEYATQAELIEPGILNMHEEVEIQVKLSPKMHIGTFVVVTLTSPQGVTESITFEA
jgi:hypothetical protein